MKDILLVEDHEQMTELLHLHLNSSAHAVTSSGRGKDALKKLEENTYDLIILDITLLTSVNYRFVNN